MGSRALRDPGAFVWSVTRAKLFQECRRKYYYRYFLAPRARRPDPPPEARHADRLKDLVSLEVWTGQLVHTQLERLLHEWKRGRYPVEAVVLNRARAAMREQFRDSQQFWHGWQGPYRPALLDRHYYGHDPLPRERAERLRQRVVTSLQEFLDSQIAARIRRTNPRDWLPVDRHASVRLEEGITVKVRPDFAFAEVGDGGRRLQIVDWKTGRGDPEWDPVQVHCYVLYAEQKWGFPAGKIDPWVIYLYPQCHEESLSCDAASVAATRAEIARTCALLDVEADRDDPLSLPPEEWFPMTEDRGRCRWCAFREMCEGALQFQSAAAPGASPGSGSCSGSSSGGPDGMGS